MGIAVRAWGAVVLALALASTAGAAKINNYLQTNLVSNDKVKYNSQLEDPHLLNPWGIALRPPGAGGHFWMSNNGDGSTTTYIGDLPGNPLHQDALTIVAIPGPTGSSAPSTPTGQVYNAASDFVGQSVEFLTTGVDQNNAATSGSAKFVFVTQDGTISSWRTNTASFMTTAQTQADYSQLPSPPLYMGVAMTTRSWIFDPANPQASVAQGNHLYAADFANNRIDTLDNKWQNVSGSFAFAKPAAVPDGFSPFNIQAINNQIYIAYAMLDPNASEPGEELHGAGLGYVARFTADGTLDRVFSGHEALNSPWGMAIAPADFGALSGDLLVANFGDGTIAGYDLTTGQFVDFLRGANGDPISIDGIWGLAFGNGVSLGTANHLYFTAGPLDETDGVFGKLAPVPEPGGLMLAVIGGGLLSGFARWRRSVA